MNVVTYQSELVNTVIGVLISQYEENMENKNIVIWYNVKNVKIESNQKMRTEQIKHTICHIY